MEQSSNIVEIEVDYENHKLKELLKACGQLDELDDGLSIYIEVNVTFNYYYSRAITSGISDNWMPSEFDYEIIAVEDAFNGNDISLLLSDKDYENIEKASIDKLELY